MLVMTMNCNDIPVREIEFYPMEADGADYPAAALPILPVATEVSLAAGGGGLSAFLTDGESCVQGRYALAAALHRAGAVPGKAVLLPAFHCRVMVEPVLYLGAQAEFYPVLADLRPDFSALESRMAAGGIPVVALLLTHYFGFPNALSEAADFCRRHGIALIEDCAHAFYGESDGRLLGTVGRYAIASPWKFLPLRDGGVLRDNSGGEAVDTAAQPWLAEVKSLAAMLQLWWRRSAVAYLPQIDAAALGGQARRIAANRKLRLPQPGLTYFHPEQLAYSALRSSRWLTTHAPHEQIARRRRENYLQWLACVRGLSGVQALFPSLPEGVVPYAFPLLVDAAGLGFHCLKLAGMPIWRWEDMAVTDCAISRDYRIRLLQLPCHQDLQAQELAWMISTVQQLSSLGDAASVAG